MLYRMAEQLVGECGSGHFWSGTLRDSKKLKKYCEIFEAKMGSKLSLQFGGRKCSNIVSPLVWPVVGATRGVKFRFRLLCASPNFAQSNGRMKVHPTTELSPITGRKRKTWKSQGLKGT